MFIFDEIAIGEKKNKKMKKKKKKKERKKERKKKVKSSSANIAQRGAYNNIKYLQCGR